MSTTQDEKVRDDALSRTAATGSGSATGQAIEQASGSEDKRLSGSEDRQEPKGAPKQGDFARIDLEEPSGLQAESAAFTTNGTIPSGMVASPGGFVPASAVPDSEAALEMTLNSSGRNPDTRVLSEKEVEGLSGTELRAIGAQRGYKMADLAGTRTQRREFLRLQGEDPRFKEKKGTTAKILEKVGAR